MFTFVYAFMPLIFFTQAIDVFYNVLIYIIIDMIRYLLVFNKARCWNNLFDNRYLNRRRRQVDNAKFN